MNKLQTLATSSALGLATAAFSFVNEGIAGCNIALAFNSAHTSKADEYAANPKKLKSTAKSYYRNNSSCEGLAGVIMKKIGGVEKATAFSGLATYAQPKQAGMLAIAVKEASSADLATARAKNVKCDKGLRITGKSAAVGTKRTGECLAEKSPANKPFPFRR